MTRMTVPNPTLRITAFGFRVSPFCVENALNAINCPEWLSGLVLDGIVAGVGAVLGNRSSDCSYCSSLLRISRGLRIYGGNRTSYSTVSSESSVFRVSLVNHYYCSMLIGTGCGVPGIMASRTIENDRDRKMTIMTTTFIPLWCKSPFYRNDCRCYISRQRGCCNLRLLYRNGSNHNLGYYA